MPRIARVMAVPVIGGYWAEDLTALQSRPIALPYRYTAQPMTPGFDAVRQAAEGVSVGLVLDGGRVAWGDCVGVAYGAKSGRDPVFRSRDGLATIERVIAPTLQGHELTSFRELAAEVDALTESVQVTQEKRVSEGELSRRKLLQAPIRLWQAIQRDEGSGLSALETEEQVTVERRLHTAIRYGVSQAILQAVALARNVTMAEVIADEWNLPRPDAPVPIHAQSGGERHHNADKMIVRRVASLPHALVDDIPEQLGQDGDLLLEYVHWLVERIRRLGSEGYTPTIHLDVHGALGQICENNLGRVLGQLYTLELAAQPYPLRIECPVMLDSREAQIQAMQTLREYTRFRKLKVQLVADEWANTLEDIRAFIQAQAADMIQIKMPNLGSLSNSIEAVLACKAVGVGAFLGGSCAETDLSARASVHVALATRPDIIMAKPGMGVDEGIMLIQNEMARTLASSQSFSTNRANPR
jgi:methylaspartate ammonia-lyase